MAPESASPGDLLGNSTQQALTLLKEQELLTEIRDLMKARA
jgi:hypothetical protein